MLKTRKEDINKYWIDETELSEDKMSRINNYISQKKNEIERMQYEFQLLKLNRLSIYKSEVYYMISEFLPEASTWFFALKNGSLKGKNLDKRRKYSEKDSYDYVINWVKKHLNIDELQIVNFTQFGLRTIAYLIEFEYKSQKYILSIPMCKNITINDFEHDGDYIFKIIVYKRTSECSMESIFSTFDEDELKNCFQN